MPFFFWSLLICVAYVCVFPLLPIRQLIWNNLGFFSFSHPCYSTLQNPKDFFLNKNLMHSKILKNDRTRQMPSKGSTIPAVFTSCFQRVKQLQLFWCFLIAAYEKNISLSRLKMFHYVVSLVMGKPSLWKY